MIVDTLPVLYYEKMVGYTPSSFAALVFAGERIEVGLKRGKFVHPALTNNKPRENGENEKEEGTHVAIVQISYMAKFPTNSTISILSQYQPFALSHYPPPYQPRTPNHP